MSSVAKASWINSIDTKSRDVEMRYSFPVMGAEKRHSLASISGDDDNEFIYWPISSHNATCNIGRGLPFLTLVAVGASVNSSICRTRSHSVLCRARKSPLPRAHFELYQGQSKP